MTTNNSYNRMTLTTSALVKFWYLSLLAVVADVSCCWTVAFTLPQQQLHMHDSPFRQQDVVPTRTTETTATRTRSMSQVPSLCRTLTSSSSAAPVAAVVCWAKGISEDDEEGDTAGGDDAVNPYQDPNYPDLEFVNYSDPEYRVDQGVGDEFFDPTTDNEESTEAQVEAMREERRMKNDEYQFETYYREILKEGGEFKGEWSVFTTSTFTDGTVDSNGRPRLARAAGPLKVISRGERIELEHNNEEQQQQVVLGGGGTTDRLEYQRILHHEKVYADSEDIERKSEELLKQEEISMGTKFWPTELSANDFRGHQGIMCVGNAYTICTAVPLSLSSDASFSDESILPTPVTEGPFAEYRAELGLLSDVLRFRLKMDYAVLDADKIASSSTSSSGGTPPAPPLHLKSLTVCRETLGMWPRAEKYKSAIEAVTQDALWGPRGAEGGLYDPPPVGSEEQASQYLLLDLEGRATVLLPYLMDQDPDAHTGTGWVTSLDWTPGKNRFQADRKIGSGKGLLGLRTLELTEVESASAEQYRPRDGGSNMRQ
jgi:hypothetical protein